MSQFTEFYNGDSANAYELLGCHRVSDGLYRFAVWAPNAKDVCVVGDFNNWLVHHDKLTLIDGIWQTELEARDGDCYKYAVTTQSGDDFIQSRPIRALRRSTPRNGKQNIRPFRPFRLYRRKVGRKAEKEKYLQKPRQHLRSPRRFLAQTLRRTNVFLPRFG